MLDTRAEIQRLFGHMEFSFSAVRSLVKVCICTALAGSVTFMPTYVGLSPAGEWAFFILLLASGLWMTEAIPAYAVALLVIGLEVAILGRPGGVFARGGGDWEIFVRPWSSPLIWLFFGGFVLAEAATKTALDRWVASRVLGRFGDGPGAVLFAAMAITFVFSMFMSNTATAAMMVAVMGAVLKDLDEGDPFARALLLGIAVAANVGGMATIIGSPPNAIAAGALESIRPISFLTWIVIGLPPALVLCALGWLYLTRRYRSANSRIDLASLRDVRRQGESMPRWRRWLVVGVFALTIGLWLSGPWHRIPSPVVSFVPIVLFAVSGVIGPRDIRALHWDVLILLAGGMALGVGVAETGLAGWLVERLPVDQLSDFSMALVLAAIAMVLSNFMSNTAAANILIPIGLAIGVGLERQVAVSIALGASAAMCLPISTPPNAVVYSKGWLASRDFLWIGVLIGGLAPLLVSLWGYFVWS
ncbi:MAG: sodium-dependent dicarboxylate transporter 2/3/5 [Candidatus Latescibacterota bacterium]